MRFLCAALLFLVIVLSVNTSLADSYIVRGGAHAKLTGAVKTFSLRKESYLGSKLKQAAETGFWVDNAGTGGKSSLFAKWAAGVSPGNETGLFGKAFVGVAGITHKDNQLGGNFQFTEDFGFGIRDKASHIAIVYTHFSSAGIFKPNKGRDFVTVEIGLEF